MKNSLFLLLSFLIVFQTKAAVKPVKALPKSISVSFDKEALGSYKLVFGTTTDSQDVSCPNHFNLELVNEQKQAIDFNVDGTTIYQFNINRGTKGIASSRYAGTAETILDKEAVLKYTEHRFYKASGVQNTNEKEVLTISYDKNKTELKMDIQLTTNKVVVETAQCKYKKSAIDLSEVFSENLDSGKD